MEALTLQEQQRLMQTLEEIVTCPICFHILQAPVTQCENGHTICKDCRARVSVCPSCRTPFIPTRNRALEEILNLIPHKCKHESCKVIVKPDDDHETWCGLRPTKCRFCNWNDCAKDLYWHVKQYHKSKLIPGDDEVVKPQSFLRTNTCDMAFFDTSFEQFVWVERTTFTPSTLCTIRYVLVPNGEIRGSFEMQFVMENAQNKIVISTKLSNENNLNMDKKLNSFTLPSSVFEDFYDENGEMKYKFSLVTLQGETSKKT